MILEVGMGKASKGDWRGMGFTKVPNCFLSNYSKLEPAMTGDEALLVVHLLRYKWDGRHPYPSNGTLAGEIGISERTVRRLTASLEKKGYLRRVYRNNSSNEFDLEPLLEILQRLDRPASAEARRGDTRSDVTGSPGQPCPGRADSGDRIPRSDVTAEENEGEKNSEEEDALKTAAAAVSGAPSLGSLTSSVTPPSPSVSPPTAPASPSPRAATPPPAPGKGFSLPSPALESSLPASRSVLTERRAESQGDSLLVVPSPDLFADPSNDNLSIFLAWVHQQPHRSRDHLDRLRDLLVEAGWTYERATCTTHALYLEDDPDWQAKKLRKTIDARLRVEEGA